MFKKVMRANASIINSVEFVEISRYSVTAYMYAENPIRANADFNKKDAQSPMPPIVPIKCPNERSR